MNTTFFLLLTFVTTLVKAQQEYTVHACKDHMLGLNCRRGTIQIRRVILGDSSCSGSRCCPNSNDCYQVAGTAYTNVVNSSCNGKPHCSVHVDIRNIGCSYWGPNNDYVKITYTCLSIQSTSAVPFVVALTSTPKQETKLETTMSSSLSSASFESWTQPKQHRTSLEAEMSTEIALDSKHSPTWKSLNAHKDEKHEAAAQALDRDSNTVVVMDKMTIMTIVIVVGVVLTTSVVSFAIVTALKKRRRVVKVSEAYDMPDLPSGGRSNTLEACRNSNIYEFIPDSGCSSARDSATGDFSGTSQEDDYLKPTIIDETERPYIFID